MSRKYRKYRRYSNDDDGIGLIILCILVSIINFILEYKDIIFISSLIIIVLYIIFKYKNDVINYVNDLKTRKTMDKLKNNSELYRNIVILNNKYNLEDLSGFYDSYQVRFKSNLKTCNIDDYLLMTIHNKYDELKKYKIKYDKLFNMNSEYLKEYNHLKQYITEEEANKLKINIKKYKKYQNIILLENKIEKFYTFKVTIFINYRSRKGFVKESISKVYYKEDFSKVMNKYKELEKSGNLIKITSNIERSKMSESLRYDVLKRDNFKCCICGMSAKDGVILHVDHIIPVSKGGKTHINNLQTLCSRCNIGKSNKM